MCRGRPSRNTVKVMSGDALGSTGLRAPMLGTVVAVESGVGAVVRSGVTLVVLDAMKMEHPVDAPFDGVIVEVLVSVGDTVEEGQVLVVLSPQIIALSTAVADEVADPTAVRPDLAAVLDRQARTLDGARPEAVARRRRTSQRTARENIADLIDPGSFVEYGSLVIAAQRRRRSVDDLIEKTPADGLVGGIASINAELFGPHTSRCVVVSYDFTVLAGTQGLNNHRKKDRLFTLAAQQRLPLVLFAEGGGGRPGDTDGVQFAGLDGPAFALYGRLSGLVPLVAIVSGRCFAGNAALAGCSDVIIATRDANLGMAGPAMIEGGGLGVFAPEEIGPMDVQVANGVVDVLVDDEAAAVAVAKRYLAYFQGALPGWSCADQELLRGVIPENRLRAYDIFRDDRPAGMAVDTDESGVDVRPGQEDGGRDNADHAGDGPVGNLDTDRAIGGRPRRCREPFGNLLLHHDEHHGDLRHEVEQVGDQRRGDVVRQVGDEGVRTAFDGKDLVPVEPHGVRMEHRDIALGVGVLAQSVNHVPVDLDREDRRAGFGKRQGERSEPGADFHHLRLHINVGEADDPSHGVRIHDEVLAERTTRMSARLIEPGLHLLSRKCHARSSRKARVVFANVAAASSADDIPRAAATASPT